MTDTAERGTVVGYFDGSSLGNSTERESPAAYCVLFVLPDGGREQVGPHPCGDRTNNEAEYMALLMLLKTALVRDYRRICIYGDSKLVVEQVNGRWRVKAENLKQYADMVKDMVVLFEKVEILWLRRADNPAGVLLEKELERGTRWLLKG